MTNQAQYRNFVPAQRSNDIRIRARLDIDQANEVVNLLLAAHPTLAELRTAGRVQFINDRKVGLFRMVAVRGGSLPADLSADDVRMLADAVTSTGSVTDPRYAGLWAERYAITNGRRMR
jgi:hypothetical protein